MNNLLLILMFILAFSSATSAQDQAVKPRKKIGLALSGGAAKGFAHIGVLQVFKENNIPIDFISGTSMGAFIGGLYSIGYSVDSLEAIVRKIQWNNMYFESIDRTSKYVDQRYKDERFIIELPITKNSIRIPVGVISGQRFLIDLLKYTQPVHNITNFDQFPIPFRAVATNLSNGRAYVFKNGNLAEAIRASMSLPTILVPIEIGDIRLIDGGIARNLPAQDVKAMGADFVIGVDVGDVLPLGRDVNDLFSVLDQSISFLIARNVAEQYQKCDAIIRPKIYGFNPTDFDSLDALIQLGRNAALEIIPELLTEIQNDTTYNELNPIVIPKENDHFTISNIMISGIPDNFIRHVLSTLYIERGAIITLADIELDVSRLLGIGLFKDVRYYLLPDNLNKGFNLVFEMKMETKETFNFSFRFDDTDNAAFIFNVNLRNRFIRSSEINGMLRIGETFEADIYAKNGYGYVAGEEAEQENKEVGVMVLDRIFSPVIFANYAVTAARMGKETELDRIELEVETDGTLAPFEAIKQGAGMLRDFFAELASGARVVIEEEEVIVQEVSVEDARTEKAGEILIEELNLPTRTINALKKHSINTLKDLAVMDEDRLLSVRNLGEKSIQEIKKLLKKEGLTE